MRGIVVLAGWLMVFAGSCRAATQEQIGSWVLICPTSPPPAEPCLLRLEKPFLDKAGVTGELEVLADGKSLVPVIALRGLSSELLMATALAGKTEASMQFGSGPREALDCAPSIAAYICSPGDDAARSLAAALPAARSVTVRVSVTVTGLKPLPIQEKTLDLSGTNQALVRLRNAGPSQLPGPITAVASQSPGALMGMADKALKAAGYPNGLADLQALLAKYRGK
ncbi:MAG: hypothetical protein QOD93_5973 [Acetobacteraceae bacterium]|nr:hypothetical protein [Acetobacteraceae bacterium]